MPCHWCGDQHGVDQLCQRARLDPPDPVICEVCGQSVAGADKDHEVYDCTPVGAAKRQFYVTRCEHGVQEGRFEQGC